MANKDTPNGAEVKTDVQSEQVKPVPEVVPKEQFDQLLKQAQDAINDLNRRNVALDNDNKILKNTLNTINRLVEKVFEEKQ